MEAKVLLKSLMASNLWEVSASSAFASRLATPFLRASMSFFNREASTESEGISSLFFPGVVPWLSCIWPYYQKQSKVACSVQVNKDAMDPHFLTCSGCCGRSRERMKGTHQWSEIADLQGEVSKSSTTNLCTFARCFSLRIWRWKSISDPQTETWFHVRSKWTNPKLKTVVLNLEGTKVPLFSEFPFLLCQNHVWTQFKFP